MPPKRCCAERKRCCVDDRVLRHGEVDEHERRQHERVAAGHEQEREAGDDARRRGRRGPASESASPCSTSHPSGSSASVSETAFRPMKSSYGTPSGSATASSAAIAVAGCGRGSAALDPDEQRDQEERRDVEHVPLLDAERLLGGERRRPRARARRTALRAAATKTRSRSVEPARHQREHDQRRERDDAEREVELRRRGRANHLRDLAHRVVARARDLVGAEDAERRAPRARAGRPRSRERRATASP